MSSTPANEMRLAAAAKLSFHAPHREIATPAVTEGRTVRSALLDSISRDIGRPLALITGAAARLKRSADSLGGSLQGELVDIIENQVGRLQQFASVLLDMARLEGDAIEIRPQMVALSDVVSVALKDAGNALQDRKTEVSLSAKLDQLWLDPAILRRVLVILIENAARQSPADSAISIQAARDSKAVRLQIMDEGDGISPADIDGIFDQVHLLCADDRNRSGAGMHLVVCRGFVEAMGGTIAAANRTDRSGAVFTITFPEAARRQASAVHGNREAH